MTSEERRAIDAKIRKDFPLIHAHPEIAYLDNSATTQKPESVLRAMQHYYLEENANPLRGLYELSVKATEAYEDAREAVREFIRAGSIQEIIFTRNASESLNLLAYSAGDAFLREGDEILITIMEHHSNLIPWQQAAARRGAVLKFLEPDEEGYISEERFRSMLSPKTKLVSMTHISNVLGVKNDVKTFARIAHENGSLFILDGAQSVPHIPVDVTELDVDFLAFSGHKMLAPMGIGVLYGKKELLEKMPPFLFGGEMIEYVSREKATWAELPHKFEAGTVNVGGAVGLHAAIEYYKQLGWDKILEREEHLSRLAMEKLSAIPHLRILGPKDGVAHHGIFTFTIEGVHPHDIAAILDSHKVNIRAGHHCAQPLMQFMKTPSTTRASFAFYNTEDELDRLVESIGGVRREMGYQE